MRHFRILLVVFWIATTFTGCNTENKNINKESGQTKQVKKTASASQPTEKQKITFIELGSVNCIPCKMMQPVMEKIEKEFVGQVKTVFYDVWTKEGKPYGQKYGIRAIPTQVFLDENGKEFHRHTGFYQFGEIKKVFAQKGVK